jgi:hypothetical protein
MPPNYVFARNACMTACTIIFALVFAVMIFMKTDLRIANNHYRRPARSAD